MSNYDKIQPIKTSSFRTEQEFADDVVRLQLAANKLAATGDATDFIEASKFFVPEQAISLSVDPTLNDEYRMQNSLYINKIGFDAVNKFESAGNVFKPKNNNEVFLSEKELLENVYDSKGDSKISFDSFIDNNGNYAGVGKAVKQNKPTLEEWRKNKNFPEGVDENVVKDMYEQSVNTTWAPDVVLPFSGEKSVSFIRNDELKKAKDSKLIETEKSDNPSWNADINEATKTVTYKDINTLSPSYGEVISSDVYEVITISDKFKKAGIDLKQIEAVGENGRLRIKGDTKFLDEYKELNLTEELTEGVTLEAQLRDYAASSADATKPQIFNTDGSLKSQEDLTKTFTVPETKISETEDDAAKQYESYIRTWAYKNNLEWDDDMVKKEAVKYSSSNSNTFTATAAAEYGKDRVDLLGETIGRYKHWEPLLKQGYTVRDLGSSYISALASMYGVDSNSVGLNDAMLAPALESGMTVTEYKNWLRQQPGYENTEEAGDKMSRFNTVLKSEFGF